jgi:hypothetical protein
MITHQISKYKQMGIFQNDDLVFLSERGRLTSVDRVIITQEKMGKICKIWTEYKEGKEKLK